MNARSVAVAVAMMSIAVGMHARQKQPATAAIEQPHCQGIGAYTTVAQTSTTRGRQVLAIDPNDRILLLSLSPSGSVLEAEPLGYRQVLPADFPFADRLPKDHAVTLLRRASCAEQKWRIWVAETIGLEAPPRHRVRAATVRRILIFREPGTPSTQPLISEEFREAEDAIVDDINGDNQTEIAIEYTDADANPWMKIWKIDDSGNLHAISLDNVRKDLTEVPGQFEIGLGDYRHGGELLFTEQRVQTMRGWHITRRYYDWNDAKQQYELSELVQSDEIVAK